VVCIVPNKRIPEYLSTLETDAKAPVAACGAEGTAFVGMWAAAVVTAQLNRYFKGLPTLYKLVEGVDVGGALVTEWNESEGRYANLGDEVMNQDAAEAYIADGHPDFRV
jgi:hypothetical protein